MPHNIELVIFHVNTSPGYEWLLPGWVAQETVATSSSELTKTDSKYGETQNKTTALSAFISHFNKPGIIVETGEESIMCHNFVMGFSISLVSSLLQIATISCATHPESSHS